MYHVVSYLTQYLYQLSLVTLVIGYELIESRCRGFTFKWDRSWVRTTINIMVADILTWDIHQVTNSLCRIQIYRVFSKHNMGWVGLWGFLWWAPLAKGKDHHGVSSGWSSVWHRSNTGLSSTQYEQIPIILGIWPFWLTPFFFRSITFWRAYG